MQIQLIEREKNLISFLGRGALLLFCFFSAFFTVLLLACPIFFLTFAPDNCI